MCFSPSGGPEGRAVPLTAHHPRPERGGPAGRGPRDRRRRAPHRPRRGARGTPPPRDRRLRGGRASAPRRRQRPQGTAPEPRGGPVRPQQCRERHPGRPGRRGTTNGRHPPGNGAARKDTVQGSALLRSAAPPSPAVPHALRWAAPRPPRPGHRRPEHAGRRRLSFSTEAAIPAGPGGGRPRRGRRRAGSAARRAQRRPLPQTGPEERTALPAPRLLPGPAAAPARSLPQGNRRSTFTGPRATIAPLRLFTTSTQLAEGRGRAGLGGGPAPRYKKGRRRAARQ